MSDQEKKKTKKVVTGKVMRRKKKKSAVAVGNLQSVWGYVLSEVFLPAARDMLYDGLVAGSGRMIYQEDRPIPRKAGGTQGRSEYKAYNRFAKHNRPVNEPDEPRRVTKRARATHDFDEIILSTRREAEEMLDSLYEELEQYDSVTVSEFYQMVGITPQYTDDNWGWTDFRGSSVRHVRGGYLLNLPAPIHLD